MTTTPRLLVIGLDGGTFDLLRPLMAQGHMPNLAELVDHGCWGPLASTIPPFTGAAWSTFITGRNPGQHGVIAFTTRDRFNYDTQGQGFVNAQRFDYTLWELLSTAGKRVGVVNVPLTYPARPVNGFMVTGMLTPAGASRFTYPPEFAARIGPDYMIDVDFLRDGERFRLTGLPPKPEMLAQIRRMTQARTAHGVRWLQEEAWEFFMLVYTSTDRVSHFFWDEVPALLAGQPSPNQAELLAFFHELDEGIGQLAAAAGPETNILFMSDHGFGPAPDRRFYVNVWLEQLGLLRPGRGRAARPRLLAHSPGTQQAAKGRPAPHPTPIYPGRCAENHQPGRRPERGVRLGQHPGFLCAHLLPRLRGGGERAGGAPRRQCPGRGAV